MTTLPTWGLVATIKAPAEDVLRFAAYHLEAGAHRLRLYLDAPCPEAQAVLAKHPKIQATLCDADHWKRLNGGRPPMHQPRQTINATHAYSAETELDWLIHMDVDEFLVSDAPVAQHLANLPSGTLTARARPMELLAGGTGAFKRFIPAGPDRERLVAELYPTFGEHLKGGFLSHLAGKIFLRTGLSRVKLRIHNAFQDGEMNPAQVDLAAVDLAHCHAPTWDAWQASFRYRLEKGSYRADLGPARARKLGGITMHELFHAIEADAGPAGLRTFYDEVCADSPALRVRLEQRGLLHLVDLDLDAARMHQFPVIP
ncbi:glycosyltransferase family 2 protein [Sulfitobacter sp. SK012]|uniref:glycosyltransferase family 2 protein n=1 Tax=Sulfitobacter sp. SK012 TaxID=1389005 RepID=UPI000E0A2EEB|nr:glycosyltransferase family 2 protein [Sulfitobacter sp. SK012]AXI46102.1 glycosyltransferase family 2 protein [Sulfitobacter sp. SK012]